MIKRTYAELTETCENFMEEFVSAEDAAKLKSERDALAAQVADLKADRDSWSEQASARVEDWDEMRKRAEKAEAEVEGLRASCVSHGDLDEIVSYLDFYGEFPVGAVDSLLGVARAVANIFSAREAIAARTTGGEGHE